MRTVCCFVKVCEYVCVYEIPCLCFCLSFDLCVRECVCTRLGLAVFHFIEILLTLAYWRFYSSRCLIPGFSSSSSSSHLHSPLKSSPRTAIFFSLRRIEKEIVDKSRMNPVNPGKRCQRVHPSPD